MERVESALAEDFLTQPTSLFLLQIVSLYMRFCFQQSWILKPLRFCGSCLFMNVDNVGQTSSVESIPSTAWGKGY